MSAPEYSRVGPGNPSPQTGCAKHYVGVAPGAATKCQVIFARALSPVGQIPKFEQLDGALVSCAPIQTLYAAHETQILAPRQLVKERHYLGHDADLRLDLDLFPSHDTVG